MGRRTHPRSRGRTSHIYDDFAKCARRRTAKRKTAEKEKNQRAQQVLSQFGESAYKMCATKLAYATEAEANFMAFAHTTPSTPLRAYRCPYCDMWHLTHKDAGDALDNPTPKK